MANSTTNLDTISSSQASKEVTANALFDAGSPATTYGRRASTSSGLTWGYYGGNVTIAAGTLSQIANGTVALTASQTNYVVAAKSNGAVSVSTATTNWNDTDNYWRLYSIVAGASSVTSYTDARQFALYTGLVSFGAMTYQGAWNASTNTPTLASGVGTKGYYYVVSVAGTTSIDGVALWSVGDVIVFNGTVWEKIDGALSEQELGNLIAGAGEKTAPIDADMVGLMDSAAGNILKKLSWANIKATAKTYFDTLYVIVGGALGTPTSGTLTNCTGLPAGGLTATATDKLFGRSTAGGGAGEEIACTAAARTVLDDATVSAMVDTLGGAAATGVGGLVRATSPTFSTSAIVNGSMLVNRPTSDVNNWAFQGYSTSAYTNGFQFTYGGVAAAGLWVDAAASLNLGIDGASGTTVRAAISAAGLAVTGALSLTTNLTLPKTVTAGGTTGAQTINKLTGTVNFAAAAASLVVTNSLVDANSIINCTIGTNDATMKSVQAVAGAGSFTIYADVAPTAETRVNFRVTN